MMYAFGDFELDLTRYELRRHGRRQPMEPQVFDVLALLIRKRDRVALKEEIIDAIWQHRFISESVVTSRIKLARRAVGDDGKVQHTIRTVHGRGYQFVADVTELPETPKTPMCSAATERGRAAPTAGTGWAGHSRSVATELAERHRPTRRAAEAATTAPSATGCPANLQLATVDVARPIAAMPARRVTRLPVRHDERAAAGEGPSQPDAWHQGPQRPPTLARVSS
jgi:DNA-binding winged helix-turn-helix (wHTH) protein